MKNSILVMFLLSGMAFCLPDIKIASGNPTHIFTTALELTSISQIEKAYKTASVCFIATEDCGSFGFGKGDDNYTRDPETMCRDEGYTKTFCTIPEYLYNQCPYSDKYYKECRRDNAKACTDAGYSQTCGVGYVPDESQTCPYDSSYKKCKCNPCSGYDYTYAQATAEGYTAGASCNSCGTLKYQRQNATCSGFQNCDCGPEAGASTCKSGTALKYSSCKSCCAPKPCNGYDLTACPSNASCYNCDQGCGYTAKYQFSYCNYGYSAYPSCSNVTACCEECKHSSRGYIHTSCPPEAASCETCTQQCGSGQIMYRIKSCKSGYRFYQRTTSTSSNAAYLNSCVKTLPFLRGDSTLTYTYKYSTDPREKIVGVVFDEAKKLALSIDAPIELSNYIYNGLPTCSDWNICQTDGEENTFAVARFEKNNGISGSFSKLWYSRSITGHRTGQPFVPSMKQLMQIYKLTAEINATLEAAGLQGIVYDASSRAQNSSTRGTDTFGNSAWSLAFNRSDVYGKKSGLCDAPSSDYGYDDIYSYYANGYSLIALNYGRKVCSIGTIYYTDGTCEFPEYHNPSKTPLGIVTYISPDMSEAEIVSIAPLSTTYKWSEKSSNAPANVISDNTYNPNPLLNSCTNTDRLLADTTNTYPAAQAARNYAPTAETRGKWCLPDYNALHAKNTSIYGSATSLDSLTLAAYNAVTGKSELFTPWNCGWKSSQYSNDKAWTCSTPTNKTSLMTVWPVMRIKIN